MSSANSGLDATLSSFTPEQQAAIKALIAQAATANQPPAPKELTPQEQAEAHVAIARDALQGGVSTVTIFDRILAVLEIIINAVFQAAGAVDGSSSTSTSAAPAASTASDTSTTDTSSAATGSAV